MRPAASSASSTPGSITIDAVTHDSFRHVRKPLTPVRDWEGALVLQRLPDADNACRPYDRARAELQ
jgi:hypothetical protein